MSFSFALTPILHSWGDFLVCLAVALLFGAGCYAARRWGDKSEIEKNLRRQGAWLHAVQRCRRADTWANNNTSRYYQIRFRDRNGWDHQALCTTDNMGGVFYADDIVCNGTTAPAAPPAAARPSEPKNRVAELELANRRLKGELERRRGS